METVENLMASGVIVDILCDPTFLKVRAYVEDGVNGDGIIEWMKLEIGDHATPYVPRLYAEELELCRRYFRRYTNIGILCFCAMGGKLYNATIPFDTEMRVNPYFSSNHTTAKLFIPTAPGYYDVTGISCTHSSKGSVGFDVSCDTTQNIGVATVVYLNTAYIDCDAEL